MLHIPGRMVDDIDVAQQFSLLSLPAASSKKAVEMSRKNKKLPHMHIDVKEEGSGRKRNTRRHSEDAPKTEKKTRGNSSSRSRKPDTEKKSSKKTNRPNVHSQTERSSSRKSGNNASAFVKKGKKAERF